MTTTRPSVPLPESTAGPARPTLLLVFLCTAGFMTFLDVSIVNVALPTIGTELGVPQSRLPYVVTAYGTLLGGFLLLCGRLADHYGRRRMLRTGLVVFAATSLAAGLARDDLTLILARGLQGLGAALIATAALSLLTHSFAEGPERNRALGAWGALSGIAAVAGVTLGGLLAEGPGWRWIFFVNVPIGLAGAALAPFVAPEGRPVARHRGFDAAGAALLTSGLVLLIYALGRAAEEDGRSSPHVLGGLGAAAVLLAAFALVERRAAAPLIPAAALRLPALRAANLVAVLLLGTVVSLFFFASLFVQGVMGYSPIETGFAYVPLAVTTAVGAGIAAKLVERFAPRPVLVAGLALAGAGLMLLWRLPADGSYVTGLLPAFLLIGTGLGLSFVPVQVAALSGVDQDEAGGVAAGLINTSQEAGGALGLAAVSTIVFHGADILRDAFLVGACVLTAAILVTVVLMPKDAGTGPAR